MYSAEQIPILQKIVLLRDTKFTTLEIKDAMRIWQIYHIGIYDVYNPEEYLTEIQIPLK